MTSTPTSESARLPAAGRGRELMIGVTGHRFLAELDKIERGIEESLNRMESAFPERTFVVCSALADGADRLVARHVLARPGARLVVPLPFPRSEYMKDFDGAASKEEFLRLLDRAERVIQLPAHPTRDEAYDAGDTYVLDHADVVLAVWDGQVAHGQTGTGNVVTRARKRALPLAWVHAGNRRLGTLEGRSLGAQQGAVTFENFPAVPAAKA